MVFEDARQKHQIVMNAKDIQQVSNAICTAETNVTLWPCQV